MVLLCLLALVAAQPTTAAHAASKPKAAAALLDLPVLFKKASPSIVVVHALTALGKEFAIGSGVVVASDAVATNAHVFKGAAVVQVSQGAKVWRVSAIARDSVHDIALLAVPGLSLPISNRASLDTVEVGQKIYVIGAPRGLEATLSDGIVSGIRGSGLDSVIQLTAPISPGSSGGGVFDQFGRLIALSTFLVTDSQNLNFAVPIDCLSALPPLTPLAPARLTRQCRAHDAADCQAQCEQGHPGSCRRLAEMVATGEGQAKDPTAAAALRERAAQLFEEGCKAGYATDCSDLGAMFLAGAGVSKDINRAAVLFEHACDNGNSTGCHNLGILYKNGTGVAVDHSRSASLFEQACTSGNSASCFNLGVAFHLGRGVPKNPAKAASLYQESCEGGQPDACSNLGALYATGEGVSLDAAKSALFRKLACDDDNGQGCLALAVAYERGRGVPVDRSRAKDLYRKACLLGVEEGCTILQYTYGERLRRPPPKAPPADPQAEMEGRRPRTSREAEFEKWQKACSSDAECNDKGFHCEWKHLDDTNGFCLPNAR